MNNQPPLSVKNLYKSFQKRQFPWCKKVPAFVAVNSISFDLRKGEILGLLGRNGAGKTTTIQMLLGTMIPTSGTISYFGKDFSDNRSLSLEKVSFASTYVRLPGRLTVYENLEFYGKLYAVSYLELRSTIDRLLSLFGISHLKSRKASALSAGEMTRAILVKAFLSSPSIVLLDEPTASLDADIASVIRDFVLEQRKQQALSIIFTSHNMDEVAQVCDRVIVLKDGTIIDDDTPVNLAARVSQTRVCLVSDEPYKIREYVTRKGLHCTLSGNAVTITVDEHSIAPFLVELANNNLSYTYISIEKPSLEDYFLQITRTT
ncbi:ABC transporter ATP-binding protein [Candidatus Dependentiae bacterium]|nr:ABC transporter ATP-binding protein [Candidatus Dependentiae bacterium]